MDQNSEFIDPNEVLAFTNALREVYPGIPDNVLNETVQLVLQCTPNDTFDCKLENMTNMLSEHGAWGPLPSKISVDLADRYYTQLLEIFPDANPSYILQFCRDQPPGFDLEEAVQILCTEGYDKIELDPLVIWDQLKDALPEADPSYLKGEAIRLALLPQQEINNFLENAIDNGDYPTMKDYLLQKKETDELAVYKQFDVYKFLETVPNPIQLFTSTDRVPALNEAATEDDVQYALTFLYNNYGFIRKKHINILFRWNKRDLVSICARLDTMSKDMKRPRKPERCADTKNVALLQEIAFLKNQKLIKQVLKQRDDKYQMLREEAVKYNLLQECQCCFDDGLIPEECYFCIRGCIFCKDCVRKGIETIVGNGELRFPCNACDSEFSLQTVQMVLPKKMFEKLVQKIGSEQAKKARLDDLETCPFCDFAMILPETEKIFKCINDDCQMESCRECRHKAHIPLRCDEIEYDEDVKRRTYIENKMTEALTRTCHKCKMVFVKENGCNKMTCKCGGKQCYLCGAAIDNYSHFGANRCALFTNDNEINLQRVVAGAQTARSELGNVQVKFDPAAGIKTFFHQ